MWQKLTFYEKTNASIFCGRGMTSVLSAKRDIGSSVLPHFFSKNESRWNVAQKGPHYIPAFAAVYPSIDTPFLSIWGQAVFTVKLVRLMKDLEGYFSFSTRLPKRSSGIKTVMLYHSLLKRLFTSYVSMFPIYSHLDISIQRFFFFKCDIPKFT